VILDGTNSRTSVDFAATQANTLRIRWTPATGTGAVNLREINTFGGATLATDAVRENPAAIAEHRDASKDASKDGKDAKDAIAQGPQDGAPDAIASKEGFLPGGLGFPPNVGIHPAVLAPRPLSP
jgi:hypothetical protein